MGTLCITNKGTEVELLNHLSNIRPLFNSPWKRKPMAGY